MLEGLEISEVSNLEIVFENRFDSEYFQKKFLKTEKFLTSKINFKIGEKFKVTDGEHGSVTFQESGVKYLTAENVKNGYVDISTIRYVDDEVNRRNARASVEVGDILISIKGTLGEVAVAEKWLLPANMNRDVAIIKPLVEGIPSEIVTLFLMSKYGEIQSLRCGSGGVQQMITLERLRKFIIPEFSESFSTLLSNLYQECQSNRINSKALYQEAENLLLSELGIDENVFKVSKNEVVTNVKTFANFENSWRLDAEYYQPKYERLENSFKRFEQITIKNLVNYPVASGTTPKSGDSTFYTDISDGVAFVRAVDIKENRVSINDVNYIRKEVHNGVLKRTKLYKGDVLFSIAGTVGRCGIFESNCEANINQACAILRFDENIVKRLYVILFFNSTIGQTIIEKYARQGVQTNLNLDELANLNIPILPMELQERIIQKIQESFSLKSQSEQLLILAKRAVELAIEEGEDVAMAWVRDNQ